MPYRKPEQKQERKMYKRKHKEEKLTSSAPNNKKFLQDNRLHKNRMIESNQEESIQRSSYKIEGNGLTKQEQINFNEAFARFDKQILSKSPLTQGSNNQVVLWAITEKNFPQMKSAYATTLLYIGKNNYKGDDYNKFENLWEWKQKKKINSDTAVRILITLNMNANNTPEELYATLLHEWYIHAVKWVDVIDAIRQSSGIEKMNEVKEKGYQKRADEEHIEYANMSDEQITQMVNSLSLEEEQKQIVIEKMKKDRNSHDKITGKPI
jgi:hypothetical protein